MDSGKKIYTQLCVSCHQPDGSGLSNVNPPVAAAYANPKKDLVGIVIQGKNTHTDLNGTVYTNNMPPNPQLTDQEVADVVTYIRNGFGNKGSAVKAGEVKSVRKALKTQP